METVSISLVAEEGAAIPEYKTEGSAGVDLHAYIPEAIVFQPFERRSVPTGLRIELPQGFEAQIRPRSGLALAQGITCLNSPGTIDSDYRGEIKVILINLGSTPATIQPGDRIAQMVVSSYTKIEFIQTKSLSRTNRGGGGFGSTGV